MSQRYVDFKIVKAVPNKYNLTPQNIKTIKVLDWERLKTKTWFNNAMSKPCWCHVEGCNCAGQKYDGFNEFWIGFYEDGRVRCDFTAMEGMAGYNPKAFYSGAYIENKYDMQVQANAIRYLNTLIDEGIISQPERLKE